MDNGFVWGVKYRCRDTSLFLGLEVVGLRRLARLGARGDQKFPQFSLRNLILDDRNLELEMDIPIQDIARQRRAPVSSECHCFP